MFCVFTHINFTRINRIEALYERSRVTLKLNLAQLFTRDTSYITSILFMHTRSIEVKFVLLLLYSSPLISTVAFLATHFNPRKF